MAKAETLVASTRTATRLVVHEDELSAREEGFPVLFHRN
jgi:hypothetical protein